MKKRLPSNLQEWVEARQRYHLSHAHVQMARELGFAAQSLRKLVASDLQPWKMPMREYLEELYFKRFGRERPASVTTVEQTARDLKRRKAAKLLAKQQRRAERALAGGEMGTVAAVWPPADRQVAPSGKEVAPSEGVEVRPATRADAEALARMRYSFRAALGKAVQGEAAFVNRCKAWMKGRLRGAETWRCWIAVENGSPIGQLWLQPVEKVPNPVGEPERYGYVTNVYVEPRARARGVGGRLVEAAVAWCREKGIESVVLWPTPESRSLCARHGFGPPQELMEVRFERPAPPTRPVDTKKASITPGRSSARETELEEADRHLGDPMRDERADRQP
jgi:GNAT superfamily N-acetyltransferase